MAFSVIVASRFPDIAEPLLKTIRELEPFASVVVVANGPGRKKRSYPGCLVLDYGKEKFVYARAMNMGIRHSDPDNVILLNDDCLLLEFGSLRLLDAIGRSRPDIGILSPLIKGCVCNPVQRFHEKGVYWGEKKEILYIHGDEAVCFPCIWINRAAIEKVGLLNEKFVTYGGEDNEYCNRTRANDFRVSVTNAVTVQHGDGGPELTEGRGKTWSLSFARTQPK